MHRIALSPFSRHTEAGSVLPSAIRVSARARCSMTVTVITIIIAVLTLGLGLFVLRAFPGVQAYFHFRGKRLVTCPETHKAEAGASRPKKRAWGHSSTSLLYV